MRLALYEPDIPQNAGTMLRLGACLGLPVDIIEPCGFLLDYLTKADWSRHESWPRYRAQLRGRLILLTTRGQVGYTDFRFARSDNLLVGRESAGVPEAVHAAADARLLIPLRPGARALNVAVAAAMVVGEALRQTGGPEAQEMPTQDMKVNDGPTE